MPATRWFTRSTWMMSALLLSNAADAAAPLERAKVPVAESWNPADLYADAAAWTKAKEEAVARIKKLKAFEASFGKSPTEMQKALDEIYAVDKELSKLATYAGLNSDQDTRDAKALGVKQELDVVITDFGAATAWLKPAVLKLGEKKVKDYLAKNKALAIYSQPLGNMLRLAPHTLSPDGEKLLADAGLVADTAENIYTILANADLQFPKMKLKSGEEITLNQAAYTKYRTAPERADREKVFKTFWQVFKDYNRTFGVSLDANVKRDMFYARARGYDSSLAAALDPNNVPVTVYKNLIDDVHKHLPTLHRYLKLRARMLGIKDLAYHDLYPSLVKKVELKYDYNQGKQLVVDALAPLGPDYIDAMKKGLDSRWIDVQPTLGKKSGAYSNGSAYDVHPYILLNYNGGYEDVSTLAHELGHTMHSYYSNKTQPYATADYPIFLAEVASTTNEALLIRHMLKNEKNPDVRLFLLGSYLEGMRTTIFRQAMFAEFELQIHATAEKGEALTGDQLAVMYGTLLKQYHGHEQGVCRIDDLYTYEWAYIPHFYYNFYVFQYATGMVAATALSERVLSGEAGLKAYQGFLKAGSSRYAIDTLKEAGVDLTTPAPFESTMKVMNQTMDEIEAILAARDRQQGK